MAKHVDAGPAPRTREGAATRPIPHPQHAPERMPLYPLAALGRQVGNRAVSRLIAGAQGAKIGEETAPAPRQSALERLNGELQRERLLAQGGVRPKVTVGAPDDPVEAEADRMADAALAGKPAGCYCAPGEPPCPKCQAAGHASIRRKPRGHDLLAHSPSLSLGNERRLGGQERDFFEARYDADLADVRIHDNPEAAASAAHLNARAFSLGSRIVFGAGEYRPETSDGRRLLAHELAHVVQGGASVRRQLAGDGEAADAGVADATHTADGAPPEGAAAVSTFDPGILGMDGRPSTASPLAGLEPPPPPVKC